MGFDTIKRAASKFANTTAIKSVTLQLPLGPFAHLKQKDRDHIPRKLIKNANGNVTPVTAL
jgi:hypothetical protein